MYDELVQHQKQNYDYVSCSHVAVDIYDGYYGCNLCLANKKLSLIRIIFMLMTFSNDLRCPY